MRLIPLFALLVALTTSLVVHATEDDFGSAIIVGLGGAFAAVPTEPGVIWTNPALSALDSSRGAASLSYRKHFDLDALKEIDASARHRISSEMHVAAAFARYGQRDLYLESRAIGAVSRRVTDNIAAGIGLQYFRTEFGTGDAVYSGFSLNFGMAGRPVETITLAGALRSIALNDHYDDVADNPGVIGEVSAAWSATDIAIGAVWSQREGDESRFGIGQRLRLVEGLEFISGLQFDPVRYTLGGRFAHRMSSIDYVYLSHADLGGTHTIGVSWHW